MESPEWNSNMNTSPAGGSAAAGSPAQPAVATASIQWNSNMATSPAGGSAAAGPPVVMPLQHSSPGVPPRLNLPASSGSSSDSSSSDDDEANTSSSDDDSSDWDPQHVRDDLEAIIRLITQTGTVDDRVVSLAPLSAQTPADLDDLDAVLNILATQLNKKHHVRVLYSNSNPVLYETFLAMPRESAREIARALLASNLIYTFPDVTPLGGHTPRTRKFKKSRYAQVGAPFTDLAAVKHN